MSMKSLDVIFRLCTINSIIWCGKKNLPMQHSFLIEFPLFFVKSEPRSIPSRSDSISCGSFTFRSNSLTMSSSAKHVVNTAKPVVKRDVNKYLARLREFLMLVRLNCFEGKFWSSHVSFSVDFLITNAMNFNGPNGKISHRSLSFSVSSSSARSLFRNQPAPLIPGGFAHKLNKNYYFERDARRQVGQPQLLFSTNALNPMLASPVVQPWVFIDFLPCSFFDRSRCFLVN